VIFEKSHSPTTTGHFAFTTHFKPLPISGSRLSQLVTKRCIASTPDLDAPTRSWQRAAKATPHGKPIALENYPLR